MVLCDATNYSDRTDFRPGRLAAKKWNVASPLFESRITKDELRRLSRSMELPNWNIPAQACLASRFPYGTPISKEILRRIEKAETHLRNKGLSVLRVRHHGDVARIEAGKNEIGKLFSMDTAALAAYLKALGWRYVSARHRRLPHRQPEPQKMISNLISQISKFLLDISLINLYITAFFYAAQKA